MTLRAAFATCRDYANLDPDDRLMIDPLAQRGVTVEPAVWNDPTVDWGRFDAVILRSTWDYPDDHNAFLLWASGIRRLINPIDMVRWNSDKRYLGELEAACIPTVATLFAAPGSAWTLPLDWGEVVVKPATSAGSRDTARYDRADPRLASHVERLRAGGRVAMLQPYRHEVETAGETGLIYADGAFSHAFRKGPLLRPDGFITDQFFAPEEIEPRRPTNAELDVGARAMSYVIDQFGVPAYGRVDLLPGPQVIEVELIEPSLYLAQDEAAAERFAATFAARLS